MTPPLIITGHGRSGTHWLAYLLGHFFEAAHEPERTEGKDVVVDCRLRNQIPQLLATGHRVVHLIRDGREVVRSTHTFYQGRKSFREACEDWATAVDQCKGLEAVRLKDLARPAATSRVHILPHWAEWSEEETRIFWDICGEQMERHGYER